MRSVTCRSCGFKYLERPDGGCPRCVPSGAPATRAPERPAAAPSNAVGTCQLCGKVGPTHCVVFRQNVGAILIRFSKKVEGALCRSCVENTFSQFTLTTFFAGWWGLTSFVLTPFLLLMNVAEYSNACRSPELRTVAGSGKGRVALSIMAGSLVATVVLGMALVVGLARLIESAPSHSRHPAGSTDRMAEHAFHEAEAKTVAYHDQTAFGNTPRAERYATALSGKMETFRSIALSQGRGDKAPSLTEGHFLTYCELRQGKICFLVHVPEFRHYDASARDALARFAWEMAREAIDPQLDGDKTRVGIGLRGALWYGAVLVGNRSDKTPQRSEDPTWLLEFFTGPPSVEVGTEPATPHPEVAATPTVPIASLPLAERLRRDIDAIGLSEFQPRHAAEVDLESLGPVSVPLLVRTAQDPTKSVEARATAMRVLGKSGSPEAIPVLLRCLADSGAGHAAGEGLRYVKDAETSVLPRLARDIESRCVRPLESDAPAFYYCSQALTTLGRFGPSAGFAAPTVLRILALQKREYGIHTTAITAAGRLGPKASEAVPYMIADLKSADSYVRQEAITGLGGIGPAAAAALPALEEIRRLEPFRGDAIDKAVASIRGAPGAPASP